MLTERESTAFPEDNRPAVGMAFKLVVEPFGQITYFRIYQGRIVKGQQYVNSRTGRSQRFSRILRIHSDQKKTSIQRVRATSSASLVSTVLRVIRIVRKVPNRA